MQDSLYVSLSAQIALERRLDTIADNVANASTVGFRATGVKFEDVVTGSGQKAVSFASAGNTYLSSAHGSLTETGNPFDFAIQGDAITSQPWDVARITVPLVSYFAIMWTASFAWGKLQGLDYARTTTLAFTAAGNNFELAIAVAISTFGVQSGQALAGVVGPLVEVPALVALVYVALWARRRYFPNDGVAPVPANRPL